MPYKDPEKQKQAQHRYYLRDKDRVRKIAIKHRGSKQRFINAIKSYPCQDCGVSWPSCAMQFDHVGDLEKVATVSKLVATGSWTRLVNEIMKCDSVCACCHALRTASRLNNSSCT